MNLQVTYQNLLLCRVPKSSITRVYIKSRQFGSVKESSMNQRSGPFLHLPSFGKKPSKDPGLGFYRVYRV